MHVKQNLPCILVILLVLSSCSITKYFKGGLYKELDEKLTIVRLIDDPERYLDKEVVISVRFYKKGDLPCPLGEGYVNFFIADRVSYIILDKVWIEEDKAGSLDSFEEMDTVLMKAKVFKYDKEKEPNLLVLEIVPE